MILVTGCAGFIGSHLAERLAQDFFVKGIDCFTDNYPREVKEANLATLEEGNVLFVEKDVKDLALSDLKDVDMIFHLAALPGVRSSWNALPSYIQHNIIVTAHLLELARKADVKRLICASSSSVYGNPSRLPTPESEPPSPIAPYGLTKLCAEQLCELYAQSYGLPIVSPRFFTVYGPRQRPDMGISKFIDAALTGKTISLYGDGTQERDFTYISDIVDGLLLAAHSSIQGPLNLGSGNPVTLARLLEIIEQETSPLHIIQEEHQKGDVEKTFADISLVKTIGFQPKVPLEEGIRNQVAWMRSERQG